VKLTYIHRSEAFPFGEINNPLTPVAIDRTLIERTFGEHGPILHISTANSERGKVIILPELPDQHVTISYDGFIAPRHQGSFYSTIFLGDCATIVMWDDEHISYSHAGRHEILAGLLDTLIACWPNRQGSLQAFVGPALSSRYHLLPDEGPVRAAGYGEFLEQSGTPGVLGFSSQRAIAAILGRHVDDLTMSDICPYTAKQAGESWASFRYGFDRPGTPRPRDCAIFSNGFE
jgi:hypothetical protein